MSRWFTIALLLPSLTTSSTSRAETQLSLEEALQRAELESPLVRRARLERRLASAARVGASVLLPQNPGLAFSLGGRQDSSHSVPPAEGFEAAVRVEQTIEIGGQRRARMREADLNIRVADVRLKIAIAETRARTHLAYVGIQLRASHLEQARSHEALAERLFDSTRIRFGAGASTEVELHLAEVELGQTRTQRIDAELELADAVASLRRLLVLPIRSDLQLITPLHRPNLTPYPLEAVLEKARHQRAELQALEVRHSALDAELDRLRREIVPNPILFFDWAKQQPGQNYVGAGIGFALPFWSRRQGERALVRAERELVDEEHQLVEGEIAHEVERAYRMAQVRAKELERWEREVVPAAETNAKLITEGWRAGKFDLFRVIQAMRETGEVRRRSLELLGALWQSKVELERATGVHL
jgi:cobalt-zinc-cadmium efflux system outer membrane protein